uniref:LPS-assembly protein LptD n=1 Tax=Hydrogenovibrio crunogenus (strain DSM 25203 / XCL-2) TaxID=317025 RepID=Q31F27_HYDCU
MSIRTHSFLPLFSCLILWGPLFAKAATNETPLAPLATSSQTKPECLPNWIAPPQYIPDDSALNSAQSDTLQQPNSLTYKLTGNVVLKQPGLVVLSNHVRLNRQTQEANIFGQVQLHRKDLIVTGDSARIDEQAKTAQIKHTKFQFTANRSHGTAKQVDINQTTQLAQLDDATYTTCPIVEYSWQARNGNVVTDSKYDWELDFDRLDIDNNRRRIYGYNTVLYFQTVPVFYTPYIDFPMDDRASGFLFPTIGSYRSLTRETAENYVAIPYYFNLAPNYDDTLTVLKMQDRGWVVENEFRYLQPHHNAELTLTGLNDQVTQKEGLSYIDASGQPAYGKKIDQRWRGKLIANQQWGSGFSSDLLWHEVSDKYFYTDIPVESALDTVSYTPRYASVNYAKGNLQAGVQLLDYLRLRETAPYNYEKRPEVTLNYYRPFESGFFENTSVNLAAESTEFQISTTGHTKPEALRTVLSPSAQYNLLKPYGSLKAEIVANKVNYFMEDNGYNNTGSSEHNINVPQYALKGGLIFERDFTLGDTAMVQTLEPELQYLYVPYQKQSQIPLFDTVYKSLDFSNLFTYNRFSGMDRIGDTNQVSAALSTRFLKQDGRPIAEAGIGQIFYLEDRKLTLNDTPTQTELTQNTAHVSDYFVKLGMTVGPFQFASTSQYSYHNYELTNANNRLKYDVSPRFKFLMTNTITNNNLPGEQEDLAAGLNWQINDKWALGSYINYNFTQERKTEVQNALRYDSCCWASELSVKETQLDNGLYNYSIQYLIEFKGLSSVGTPFKKYLNNKLNF